MLCAFLLFIISATAEAAEISAGSGVVIGTQGEILTNAHVVEACSAIDVRFSSGNSELAVLVARDEKNDLAVIRASLTNIPATSVATFRDGPVRAGDAVVALGYPLSGLLASTANLSVGYVSALAGLADDSRYLQISAPVQPGNSGGPLLDTSGHVLGIVTAKLNAARVAKFTGDIPQNVNFALKVDVARTFLDSKGIAYRKATPSDQQLSPADVGDIARPFTVHIECEQTASRVTAAAAASGAPGRSRGPTTSREPLPLNPDFTTAKMWCAGKDRKDNPPFDLRIIGCTALIQSGQLEGRYLVAAIELRGHAYHDKGDFTRAISDYTEAIRLDPKNESPLISRAITYHFKKDYDRSILDYTEALRLKPEAKTFRGRGLEYYLKGDYDRAILDLTEALRLNPNDSVSRSFRDRASRDKLMMDFPKALGRLGRQRLAPPPNPE
jgi:hypothetical protein